MSLTARLRHFIRHPRSVLPGAPRGIINSARDWVRDWQQRMPADIRRGPHAAVFEVDAPALQVLMPPKRLQEAPPMPCLRLFPVQPTALFSLRGARVLGRDAVVISPDNQVFAEFTYVDESGGIDHHSVFRRRRFPNPRPLAGWYATLSYPSAFAYFHWVVESLPRMRLLEPYISALDGVFVPEGLTPSMQESLILLGLRAKQLIPMQISSHFAPEHLLVPAFCAGLDMPNWAPEYLRSRVLDTPPPIVNRRLYLSRGKTARRRLLNEEALLPILARHGFDVVHPQDLGFKEQAQLFASARCVIGPSGAALTNAIFLAPGGALAVLQPHSGMGPHVFYSLASAAGLHYWELHGILEPGSAAPEHSDFRIDPDNFERLLVAMSTS